MLQHIDARTERITSRMGLPSQDDYFKYLSDLAHTPSLDDDSERTAAYRIVGIIIERERPKPKKSVSNPLPTEVVTELYNLAKEQLTAHNDTGQHNLHKNPVIGAVANTFFMNFIKNSITYLRTLYADASLPCIKSTVSTDLNLMYEQYIKTFPQTLFYSLARSPSQTQQTFLRGIATSVVTRRKETQKQNAGLGISTMRAHSWDTDERPFSPELYEELRQLDAEAKYTLAQEFLEIERRRIELASKLREELSDKELLHRQLDYLRFWEEYELDGLTLAQVIVRHSLQMSDTRLHTIFRQIHRRFLRFVGERSYPYSPYYLNRETVL